MRIIPHRHRSRTLAGLLLLALVLPVVPLLPAGAHPTGEFWTTRASIMPGSEGAAGSFIGGRFYVSHGFVPGIGDSTENNVYDPVSDTWTPLPQPNVPRSELAGVAADDGTGLKHYAIGGRGPLCPPTGVCDAVEIYDPATATWTTGAPMPTPRAGLGAAAIGSLVYVVGGRACGSPYCGPPLNTLEIYVAPLNLWLPGAPMPVAVLDIYSVTALGGRIYVIGGHDGSAEVATMQIYDPALGVWSLGAPMPTKRSNAIAGVCDGHIYVIGGTNGGGTNLATVEEYDPATGAWNVAPSLPSPASELANGAVTGPDLIMATGSGMGGSALSQNYALQCKERQG